MGLGGRTVIEVKALLCCASKASVVVISSPIDGNSESELDIGSG